MADDNARLEREVRYLHAAFFHREMPEEIGERYIGANRRCLDESERSRRRMFVLVERGLDAEAVELALRWRRLDTLLTRKIQILFYLVEVRADYYGYFINQDAGRRRAWLALAGSVPGSLWRFTKGSYLIWRYGLV